MDSYILTSESSEDYHDNLCVSNSKRKAFDEKGAHYFHGRYITKTIPKEEPTEALILGCAFDTLMTEGVDAFKRLYVIKPEGMSLATTVGKAWKAANVPPGSELITHPQWMDFVGMSHSLRSHPLFHVLIHPDVHAQVTVRMPVSRFGVGLQCRPDWLSFNGIPLSDGLPYNVNMKTTADFNKWVCGGDLASPRAGSPVYDFGYHQQAALDGHVLYNCPGIGETKHFLFVIEKQMPYRCGVFCLSEAYLDAGWAETEASLLNIQRCAATGIWPNSPDGIMNLEPPGWLTARADRKALAAL